MPNATARRGRPPRPVPEGTKWCPKCEQARPLEEFGKHAARPDGLTARCRPCHRQADREWWERNDPDGSKRKARRRRRTESATEEQRRKDREAQRRRVAADPERVKALHRDWVDRNREHMSAYWGAYTKRRRAMKRDATIVEFTADQLEQRLAYFGHKCWICGADYQAVDHVKPLAKGGAHALANLRPICNSCNSSKGAKWPYPTKGGPRG